MGDPGILQCSGGDPRVLQVMGAPAAAEMPSKKGVGGSDGRGWEAGREEHIEQEKLSGKVRDSSE